MNAGELIETLLRLGTVIRDASTSGGKASPDWKAFLGGSEFKSVLGTVQGLLAKIKEGDFAAAIGRIEKKQKALLGGRSIADLPTDKLIQYSELGSVKLVLQARRVRVAAEPDFVKWLMDDALPVLARAAPVVLALVL